MPPFSEIVPKILSKIDYKKAIADCFTDIVMAEIEAMIKDRLYKTGIAGSGIKLKTNGAIGTNVYKRFTIEKKIKSNRPYNTASLYDTGNFYRIFTKN